MAAFRESAFSGNGLFASFFIQRLAPDLTAAPGDITISVLFEKSWFEHMDCQSLEKVT